jgi:hypothetical protein
MNPLIQLEKWTSIAVIAVLLACFGPAPLAQAVVPAPDGGYPGLNTAEGQNALFSLSTGVANVANGWFSLSNNTDGSFNTAVGAGTLLLNIGDQTTGEGIENTAVGAAALLFNTLGSENIAVGAAALLNNIDGSANTAVGVDALTNNTDGQLNVAVGSLALMANTTGAQNTVVGRRALQSNVAGSDNTAMGHQALIDSTGDNNTAVGKNAGDGITSGNNIIAIGFDVSGVSTTNGEVSDSCYIGNIIGAGVDAGTSLSVFVDQDGKLGTTALPGTETLPRVQTEAMLRKIEELQVTVTQQRKGMEILTAQLKEQAAQIRKVSAQLELSKPAPKTVLHND